MIKTLLQGTMAMAMLISTAHAQVVSNFDTLSTGTNGYWNGSDTSGGFQDGRAFFENSYDTTWDSWTGFAYSSLTDSSTAGFGNQYSTYAGQAYNGSTNFALANVSSWNPQHILLDSTQTVQGFYITNSTYAALSMKFGDAFAKAFGADTLPNGDDTTYTGAPVTTADWFKVEVFGVIGDSVHRDTSVSYYLADYRFALDVNDYILQDWEWVNLESLGNVDGLHFELSSSDTGQYGMNTPAYFCMDDLTIGISTESRAEFLESIVSVFPNPASNRIHFKVPENEFNVIIRDQAGRMVASVENQRQLDISDLENGMYIALIEVEDHVIVKRFIKQ